MQTCVTRNRRASKTFPDLARPASSSPLSKMRNLDRLMHCTRTFYRIFPPPRPKHPPGSDPVALLFPLLLHRYTLLPYRRPTPILKSRPQAPARLAFEPPLSDRLPPIRQPGPRLAPTPASTAPPPRLLAPFPPIRLGWAGMS